MNQITKEESKKLSELEGVIERNLKAFYEVGAALMKIRDEKLYLKTHETFEEYCNDKWEFSRRRAYQYIEATEVVNNVKNFSQITVLPENESHAKSLSKLQPEVQKVAWKKAVETAPNGKITAKHVSDVVSEFADSNQIEDKKESNVVQIDINDYDSGMNMSDDFKEAYSRLFDVIQKAKKEKWKETTKLTVIRHLQKLFYIVEFKRMKITKGV